MADISLQKPAPAPVPRRRRRGTRLISLATVAGLLVLWGLVSNFGLVPPMFLPTPQAVFGKLVTTATTGFADATLAQHLAASLARVFAALALALVVAVPVGVAIGTSRIIRGILDPLIEFYRPIPPLAYLPLVVIWFGIGEAAKILVIFLAVFAPVAIATATGVRAVPPDRLRAARALGATRLQLLRHVILPNALPEILTGVRIGLGVGWSTLVAAELVAATSGLGFMIKSAADYLVTEVVILGILVIAAVAFALEALLRVAQRRLTPWHGKI